MLTILRNRVYLGEVFFREQYHPAPHPRLIDPEVFDAAQQLLADRGRDWSTRASNSSDYLLHGLIVCAACGKHFVGAAAQGNRYRYYTCFSRYRYGTKTCAADRLPAGELEDAVLSSLLTCFERTDLLQHAVDSARTRAQAAIEQQKAELAVIEADVRKTEQAIERYLRAFEAGILPEAQCGGRLRELGVQIAELRDRRSALAETLDTPEPHLPPDNEIARHPSTAPPGLRRVMWVVCED